MLTFISSQEYSEIGTILQAKKQISGRLNHLIYVMWLGTGRTSLILESSLNLFLFNIRETVELKACYHFDSFIVLFLNLDVIYGSGYEMTQFHLLSLLNAS